MATPAQLAEIEQWLEQVGEAIAQLDKGTIAAILAAYEAVDDWERPSSTLAAAAGAMAASQAGRTAVAELAAQFISLVTGILRGTGSRQTTAVPSLPYPRNADPFDVYSRPIFVYRDALAAGLEEAESELAAFRRAEDLALTDNLLARRDASIAQLEREQVSHYRRVIRPELSETGVCGLCIAASVRVYTRGDLMEIHTRCKCEVIPILGAEDPGERFNLADMRRLYGLTPGTRKEDLVKTRYTVEHLDELGPVLVPAA